MSIGANAISLGILFKLDRNNAVVAQRAHNAGGAQVADESLYGTVGV